MTVKKLIEKLQEMNPEQEVFVTAEMKAAHLNYWDIPIVDVQQTAKIVTLFISED